MRDSIMIISFEITCDFNKAYTQYCITLNLCEIVLIDIYDVWKCLNTHEVGSVEVDDV